MSARDEGTDSTALPVLLATGGVLALAVLALVSVAFALFGFGFIAVLPLVLGAVVALPVVAFAGYRLATGESETGPMKTSDPVDELRERYARGEIDEAEFERKLERLLETEDLDASTTERDGAVEIE